LIFAPVIAQQEISEAPKGCGRADCCQLLNNSGATTTKKHRWFPCITLKPYHPNSELLYPPGFAKHELKQLMFWNKDRQWLGPTALNQLLQIMSAFPDAKMVGGSSEVQIEVEVCFSNFSGSYRID
jgi:xanthine dehydrogenase/oxidase